MASVRGEALNRLNLARNAANDASAELTVPTQEAQNEVDKKIIAALWAVFDYVDAAELAGV